MGIYYWCQLRFQLNRTGVPMHYRLIAFLLPFLLAAQAPQSAAPHVPGSVILSPASRPAESACHVAGDGVTDDTAALQACVNNLPDYHVLYIPAGARMKITRTIKLSGKYGGKIACLSSVFGGPSVGKDAPTFIWAGPDGGTMWDYEGVQNFITEGCAYFSTPNFSAGSGGASLAINVDNHGPRGGPITTNDEFSHLSIQGMRRNPGFRGIAFALNSNTNVENMTVHDTIVACSYGAQLGQAIVVGPSQNAFHEVFGPHNSITGCKTGIYGVEGNGKIVDSSFNLTTTDIFWSNPYGPIAIEGNDSENMTNFWAGNGARLSDNRIAACNPPHPPATGWGCIWNTGSGTLILEHNSLQGIGGSGVPVAEAPHAGGALFSLGNSWGAPNGGSLSNAVVLSGFATFTYNSSSQMDSWQGGGTPLFLTGALTAGGWGPPPATGLSIWQVASANGGSPTDPKVGHYMLSENGAAYKYVTPVLATRDPGACRSANDRGNVWIDTSGTSDKVSDCLMVKGKATWVAR